MIKWFDNAKTRIQIYWILVFVLCIVSRLVTTIYYIEDPDSLRFALSAHEYDVNKLQPHFPGYPVYCFFLQICTFLIGSFSFAFSIIGGCSSFLIIYFSVAILKEFIPENKTLTELFLTVFLFFNPMIWLMANRYMPDIMGLAIVMSFFYFFISKKHLLALIVASFLAGVKLTYMPIVIVPTFLIFIQQKKYGMYLLTGIISLCAWLIPFIYLSNWNSLWETAMHHTQGHFTEWGGGISEEESILDRINVLIESVWAHGLGGYWHQRHWITLLFSFNALILIISFLWGHKKYFNIERYIPQVIFTSIGLYILWIFFAQNITYKPRHILPIVPFILIFLSVGYHHLSNRNKMAARVIFMLTIVTEILTTNHLVRQHIRPSAIAQTKDWLKGMPVNQNIISIPLVNDFMKLQGVKANFNSFEIGDYKLDSCLSTYDSFIVIGNHKILADYYPDSICYFYHNPYVNKMWPKIEVRLYKENKR